MFLSTQSLYSMFHCLHEASNKDWIKILYMPLLLWQIMPSVVIYNTAQSFFEKGTHQFSLTYPNSQHSNTQWLIKILPQFQFGFFVIYKIFLRKTKHLFLFPIPSIKTSHTAFPNFKIPNTRSSPAFLPIQFKLREGQRYNLKYKMTNHVHEFQIHIYSCIWLWICITDLKCSSNKVKHHYGTSKYKTESFTFLPLFFNFFIFFL